MRKDRIQLFLLNLIFQVILFSPLYSQNANIKFEHITTEQGLASNTVYDIIQDRFGFIWFGTNDGLCRYHGHNIKIYRYDPLDSNSISSSWASRLFEDRSGNIWIGTVRGGVNKFDPITEKFISFQHEEDDPHSLSDDTAFGICQDTSGTIWIGTWKGLDKLVINGDPDSNNQQVKFIHYQNDPDNPNSLSDPRIWHIYIDQSNVIWIATQDGGLNKFDIEAEQFTNYKHDPQNPHSISNNCVRYSYEDPAGDGNILWIGTKGGLNKFNKTTEIFTRLQHNPDDSTSLSDNIVVRIRRANNGTLWIGTAKGLNKFIPSANPDSSMPSFDHYQHDKANLLSLSNNFVYSIFEDRSGVLWLGTIGGGVNKISSEQKKFLVNTRLGDVTTLFEDSDGIIWSGTTNGLARYDPSENDVVRYQNIPGNENSLLYNNVHFIREDPYYREKTLWIACYGGGLDRLVEQDNGRSFQFTHFKHDPVDSLSINSECVDMLYFDNWVRMWIGTCEGLNLFNRSTETFTYFEHDPNNPYSLSSKWVTTICQAAADSNVLWVGTENGFNKFLINENIFIRYRHDPADSNSLAHDYIQAVHADSYHQGKVVWIGTFGGGLDKFDSETEKFTHFTEEHGLINNTIASIVEDDSFNLWISTKKGISKFDLRTETFKNYSQDDGIYLSGFNPKAYFKNKRGEIYFGGNEGLVIFHPDSIKDNSHIPPAVVTDFKIFNKSIKLSQAIYATKQIRLNYKQNFFSFDFASLDYTNPKTNQYAYMLQELDRDWVYAGNRTVAYYTDVKPGTYYFHVKGSNNDGIWNEDGTSIKIIVSPPFWRTWWFYSLLGLVLVGMLGWGYHFRLSLLAKERNAQQAFSRKLIEEIERGRKRIANELHDSLGQNLLITKNEIAECLNTESLSKSCASSLKEILSLVADSINEVREIAYNLHPHQLDRLGLTKAIESIVNKVSHSSATKFSLEMENVDRLVPKENEIHIYRVVQEGLNNVIRHAEAKNVWIKISRADDAVKILIKDDGKGFDPKKYDPEHLSFSGLGIAGIGERLKILNGEWDIETVRKKGTNLKITIPIKG